MSISKVAHDATDFFDSRGINPYISLAKLALWLCSIVFLAVVIGGSVAAAVWKNTAYIGNVVGSAQALTVIALSVLGFHSYSGSQAFYLARHLGKPDNILDSAPDGGQK